jgi:hypothetical protein
MSRNKSWLTAAAVASALFAISAPAHAQATRTWVSGVGSDADPCSRTAPCKTFAGAISKTATNGFINCLDPAGYGAVTITRSMTIDCHETLGSILAGQEGTNGIMEDMSITGMTKNGISDTRTEGKTSLVVKNSIIANNAGSGVSALAQDNSVVLDNVHSVKNAYGAAFGKTNNGAVNRSVFSNNTTAGIETDPGAAMMMDNTVVSHNTTGIASSGGQVAFGNSDVLFNGTAVVGSTLSFGNNRIFANTAAGTAPSPAGAPSTDLGQQ